MHMSTHQADLSGLLTTLLNPGVLSHPQGEIPKGKLPYYNLPVFKYHEGYLSTNYKATYYELALRHPEVPRWTALQKEAVQYFNALARVRHMCRLLDQKHVLVRAMRDVLHAIVMHLTSRILCCTLNEHCDICNGSERGTLASLGIGCTQSRVSDGHAQ